MSATHHMVVTRRANAGFDGTGQAFSENHFQPLGDNAGSATAGSGAPVCSALDGLIWYGKQ